MALIIDPKKQFINIEIFYIEQTKAHGNSIFHFIKSKEDMQGWKEKGYKTQDEIAHLPEQKPQPPGAAIAPNAFDPNKVIQKITTTWKRMSWGDQNQLVSRSLRSVPQPDGKTTTEFDGVRYRDNKLKICLKSWSIKDEQGNDVPVTDGMIDMLAPEVANEMLTAFEQVTEVSQEKLKN